MFICLGMTACLSTCSLVCKHKLVRTVREKEKEEKEAEEEKEQMEEERKEEEEEDSGPPAGRS